MYSRDNYLLESRKHSKGIFMNRFPQNANKPEIPKIDNYENQNNNQLIPERNNNNQILISDSNYALASNNKGTSAQKFYVPNDENKFVFPNNNYQNNFRKTEMSLKSNISKSMADETEYYKSIYHNNIFNTKMSEKKNLLLKNTFLSSKSHKTQYSFMNASQRKDRDYNNLIDTKFSTNSEMMKIPIKIKSNKDSKINSKSSFIENNRIVKASIGTSIDHVIDQNEYNEVKILNKEPISPKGSGEKSSRKNSLLNNSLFDYNQLIDLKKKILQNTYLFKDKKDHFNNSNLNKDNSRQSLKIYGVNNKITLPSIIQVKDQRRERLKASPKKFIESSEIKNNKNKSFSQRNHNDLYRNNSFNKGVNNDDQIVIVLNNSNKKRFIEESPKPLKI
jgi:hypothetical protein